MSKEISSLHDKREGLGTMWVGEVKRSRSKYASSTSRGRRKKRGQGIAESQKGISRVNHIS